MFVNCETQEEVDELWRKLTAGGEESQCGWLKDKFGLSWQIIPTALCEDAGQGSREVQAGHAGHAADDKIDIARLKQAHEGE